MIKKLENCNEAISNQIYNVFQSAYKVEARLIGTLNFPPLLRSADDIRCSKTKFFGYIENGCIAGVIEVVMQDHYLDINSLTVDPNYFRKGIASKLIRYVLGFFEFSKALVETAVVNLPAINLYKRHGFIEFKRWTPAHGIEKVAMQTEL